MREKTQERINNRDNVRTKGIHQLRLMVLLVREGEEILWITRKKEAEGVIFVFEDTKVLRRVMNEFTKEQKNKQ